MWPLFAFGCCPRGTSGCTRHQAPLTLTLHPHTLLATGHISDDHLRLMMHFRIPVFHSEFATFIELLKVNNLLPTA